MQSEPDWNMLPHQFVIGLCSRLKGRFNQYWEGTRGFANTYLKLMFGYWIFQS